MKHHIVELVERVGQYLKNQKEIEHLHQLRVQARRTLAHTDEDTQLYEALRATIKKSNKIRDIDVMIHDTMPLYPKKIQSQIKSSKPFKKLHATHRELTAKFLEHLKETDFIVLYAMKCLMGIHDDEETGELEEPAQASPEKPANTNTENAENKPLIAPSPKTAIESAAKKKPAELPKSFLGLDDKTLHKLRLAVKKLRYRAESNESENQKKIQCLKNMQESLGKIHDMYVFVQTLKNMGHFPEKLLSEVDVFSEKEKHALIKQSEKALQKMSGC